jgi:hypothetical protein
MNSQELNQKELNELLGGEVEKAAGNNKNKNSVMYCKCLYYDGPSVVNKNTVFPCNCICIWET